MLVFKNKGIAYSNYVIEKINEWYADEKDLVVGVETFYNCREQGYVLEVHNEDYEKGLCIWVYAQRNSDEPTITWSNVTLPKESANMYSEEDWADRTFSYNNVDAAADKAISLIKEFLKKKKA